MACRNRTIALDKLLESAPLSYQICASGPGLLAIILLRTSAYRWLINTYRILRTPRTSSIGGPRCSMIEARRESILATREGGQLALDFNSFSYCEGLFDLHAMIPDRAVHLCMSQD